MKLACPSGTCVLQIGLQPRRHNLAIPVVSHQSAPACVVEFRIIEDDQFKPIHGQQRAPIVIIPATLLNARHTRHCSPIIEQSHAVGMLPLVVFDHETNIGIVSVDWQRGPAARGAGITEQKRKAVLA